MSPLLNWCPGLVPHLPIPSYAIDSTGLVAQFIFMLSTLFCILFSIPLSTVMNELPHNFNNIQQTALEQCFFQNAYKTKCIIFNWNNKFGVETDSLHKTRIIYQMVVEQAVKTIWI